MALVYLGMHLAPLTLFWTGLTVREGMTWLVVGLVLLNVRGLCMSAGYHRYFGHRSFKMNRCLQFLCAVGGCTALRGRTALVGQFTPPPSPVRRPAGGRSFAGDEPPHSSTRSPCPANERPPAGRRTGGWWRCNWPTRAVRRATRATADGQRNCRQRFI